MYINREPELILNPVPSFLHKGWDRQKEYVPTTENKFQTTREQAFLATEFTNSLFLTCHRHKAVSNV